MEEEKTVKHTLTGKNVSKKLHRSRNSPKASTSKEETIALNPGRSSEIKMSDTISNSYLFAKDKPHISPLDSNSSFLYHYFDGDNNDVCTYDNNERKALGKLIKNYLDGDNVLRPSLPSWTERNPRSSQKLLPLDNSSLPLNTRILNSLQPGRIENDNRPTLISRSYKPEIYNLDPFGNDSAEKDHLRQSIKAASQKYETALKTLQNVINRLSEPWPQREQKD